MGRQEMHVSLCPRPSTLHPPPWLETHSCSHRRTEGPGRRVLLYQPLCTADCFVFTSFSGPPCRQSRCRNLARSRTSPLYLGFSPLRLPVHPFPTLSSLSFLASSRTHMHTHRRVIIYSMFVCTRLYMCNNVHITFVMRHLMKIIVTLQFVP